MGKGDFCALRAECAQLGCASVERSAVCRARSSRALAGDDDLLHLQFAFAVEGFPGHRITARQSEVIAAHPGFFGVSSTEASAPMAHRSVPRHGPATIQAPIG